MQYNNAKAIRTPIISKVILLNKTLADAGRKLPKGRKGNANGEVTMSVDIRHNYFDAILKNGAILFRYAMRQLKGKDYLKRALDVIEEIQADSYLVLLLGGWNERKCAEIDRMCDEIAEQLHAITAAHKSPNHQVHG